MVSKYRAVKTTIDGTVFDSKKESQRYIYLKALMRAGKIKELELQPKFLLMEGFRHKDKKIRDINYIADFKYFDVDKDVYVVEDVKGVKTKEYLIKSKLFLKQYGDQYEFLEV